MYIENTRTPQEAVRYSMEFMKEAFPPNILAQTKNDLLKEFSLVNQFLINITNIITEQIANSQDQESNEINYMCLLHFRATISTYNGIIINHIPLNHPIVFESYMQVIGM